MVRNLIYGAIAALILIALLMQGAYALAFGWVAGLAIFMPAFLMIRRRTGRRPDHRSGKGW